MSGGNVTITKSAASQNGGSGGVGGFIGPRTGDEGCLPQEVARRASWAMQFWGRCRPSSVCVCVYLIKVKMAETGLSRKVGVEG